jgi:hypothetical protein
MEQPDSNPTCPICGRLIDPNAETCPECGFQFVAKTPVEQHPQVRSAEHYPTSPANTAKRNFPIWGWILIVVAVMGCIAFCVLGTGLAGILMWRSQPEPGTTSIPTEEYGDYFPTPIPDADATSNPEEDQDDGGAIIQVPTAQVSKSADPVEVVDTWFMQDKNNPNLFNYGFILKNPNPDLVLENVTLQAAAYDADDTVLGTGSTYASAILPGQDLAVPGFGITIPEGTVVDRLDVQVTDAGRSSPMSLDGNPFAFDKIKLFTDTYNSTVTGVMTFSGAEAVTGVFVSAVGFDGDGKIVGINSSYESLYVEPGNAVPVAVTTSFSSEPAVVQFYATYSPGSQYEVDLAGGLPKVSAWGYSVDSSRYVNYAVVLKSPTDAELYQYLSCRVVVYDKEGYVLAISSDMINSFFPGEKQALAGGVSLPGQIGFEEIDRIDVLVQPPYFDPNMMGLLSQGITKNPLKIDAITFFPGDYSSKVTAEMKNSSDYTINSTVVAVLYDASGTIIGGARAYPAALPAGGKVAIEVPIYQSVQPDKVELFASINSAEK